ncbi:MAG: hypothetical protein ACFB3T_12235, partial [Geminicoccaceae bacterium]
ARGQPAAIGDADGGGAGDTAHRAIADLAPDLPGLRVPDERTGRWHKRLGVITSRGKKQAEPKNRRATLGQLSDDR